MGFKFEQLETLMALKLSGFQIQLSTLSQLQHELRLYREQLYFNGPQIHFLQELVQMWKQNS